MKKLLAILLCCALIFGFTGCEASRTVSSEVAASTNSAAPAVALQPEPAVYPEAPPNFQITLTFLGDMILANQQGVSSRGRFSEYAEKYSPEYFLSKVSHIFKADDFTLANLENVLSDRELTPKTKDYEPAFWFKSKTDNVKVLSSSSIEGVLLTNNHIMDYGSEGFADTTDTLENAGIQYGTESNIINLEKNGFKIAVVCTGLWVEYNKTVALRQLEKAKGDSDFQIVFFHGGTEKLHAPEQFKINCAHSFVDAGADLVVGGHPHVLQPREIYKDVEIIYSLGNFCYGGALRPENRTVIYQYTLTINPLTGNIEDRASDIIPCYVYTGNSNNYQPAIIEQADEKQKVLDFMDGKTDSPI